MVWYAALGCAILHSFENCWARLACLVSYSYTALPDCIYSFIVYAVGGRQIVVDTMGMMECFIVDKERERLLAQPSQLMT